MPNRILRADLFKSERFIVLSDAAQLFFIRMLTVADDMARLEGGNLRLRMDCYPGRQLEPEVLEKMLCELADEDLVRLYHVDGKRYVFIPRFRQRLRYPNSKIPAPPNEINDIAEEKTDSSRAKVRPKSVSSPLEVEVEVEVEERKDREKTSPAAPVDILDGCPPAPAGDQGADEPAKRVPQLAMGELVNLYHRTLPMCPRVQVITGKREAAARARWRAWAAMEGWETREECLAGWGAYFAKVAESKFLTGREHDRQRRPFVASFDWLMAESNFVKVYEGKYSPIKAAAPAYNPWVATR